MLESQLSRSPSWKSPGARRRRVILAVACAGLTLAAGAAVHLQAQTRGVAHIVKWAAPAPRTTPSIDGALPVPTAVPAAGEPTTGQPSFDSDFWHLLNTDTATTTRGQYGIVRDLSAAIREQIQRLISSAERGGNR